MTEKLSIDSDFWDLYAQLTALVYHTDPSERLGAVFAFLDETYPGLTRSTKNRIENHVLRTVAWIEDFRDRPLDEEWQ